MRTTILVTGIILLFIGIIGYVNTDKIISKCESEASKARLFTSEYRQVCDNLPLLNYLMPTVSIIGLGLMGYGVVTKKKIIKKLPEEKTTNSFTDDYIKMAKNLKNYQKNMFILKKIRQAYDIHENKRYIYTRSHDSKNGLKVTFFFCVQRADLLFSCACLFFFLP